VTTISRRSQPAASGVPLKAGQVQGAALIASFALAAVGFIGFIHPAMQQRAIDAATATSLRNQIDQQNAATAQLKNTGMDAATLSKAAIAFSDAFPSDYHQDSWLAEVNAEAASAGVSIDRIDVQAPQVLADPDGAAPQTSTTATQPTASTPAQGSTTTTPPTTTTVEGASPSVLVGTVAESKVTLTTTGAPKAVIAFVGSLESSTRPLVVTTYGSNVDPKSGKATASIGGSIYLASLPVKDPNPADNGTTGSAQQ
jgi:hypothetical protein